MEQFAIWEGFLPDLEKKVATIRRKCARYGTEFHFAEIGEEFRDVTDPNTINPLTGKPVVRRCRFVLVEAEGVAIVNGWEFVASVEHTAKGNIYAKALTDIEIPARYRNSACFCEHCNSDRARKSTFIIRNIETGDFKQIGRNCLNDYTHGMNAAFAAYVASLKEIFREAEDRDVFDGFGGWGRRYYPTEEILRYAAETIRKFGYVKSTGDSTAQSTRSRLCDIYAYIHGDTKYWEKDYIREVADMIEKSGFNPDSEEAKQMATASRAWIAEQPESNDYMHNLKVAAALDYVDGGKFGLLVSLFPAWNRELEREAARKAEAAKGAASDFVGNVGDRLTVDVESVKIVTSWESSFDGYHTTTTYVYKIVGKDGNIYTWKTSKIMNEDFPPKSIKGTVKEHKTFRDVKQTELTRCKIDR